MSDFSLTVLNANGKDEEQYFPDYAGEADLTTHPPINYHAYAACVAGSVQNDIDKTIELNKPVLFLIRKDMKSGLKVLKKLKDSGLTVAVSLKETGYHQLHSQLSNPKQLELFKHIVQLADGVISPTKALVAVYQSLRPEADQKTTRFIPTPYPVDDPRWDFSKNINERNGIFIGTRELNIASRNHLQSLILISSVAHELKCPVGLINKDGKKLKNILRILDLSGDQVNINSKMPYVKYLQFMSNHRCVFQLDQSMVPGQVAGDCSLTRQVCLGGNGAIDNILFPGLISTTHDRSELLNNLIRLMTENDFYNQVNNKAAKIAKDQISFTKAAKDLQSFYSSI